jgi:hypothetical protein
VLLGHDLYEVAVGGMGLLGALFSFRHTHISVDGRSDAARLAGRGQGH